MLGYGQRDFKSLGDLRSLRLFGRFLGWAVLFYFSSF